jgi:hypothetical protein
MNRSVHAEVYILRAAEVTFSAGRNSYEAVLMGDPPTVFVSKEDVRAIQTQHVIGVVERAGEAFHRALINSTVSYPRFHGALVTWRRSAPGWCRTGPADRC